MTEELRAPRRGRALLGVVLCALLLKLCVILAPPDQLLPNALGMFEELYRGVGAREFIEGPLLPWMDYQINHFSGGSLVVALLAVPSFLCFGFSLVALRLVTLVFSTLSVGLLFLILDRYHGRRAAWVGALLLACCPPGYAIVSATAWGTHLEGNALMLLLAYLFLRLHEAREPRSAPAFLLGVVGGFAVWFGYVAIVVVAALVATELLLARSSLRLRWYLWRVVGFLVGLAPWFVYNVSHDFAGLTMYGQTLGTHIGEGARGDEMRSVAWRFLSADLPGSFFFDGLLGVSGRTIDLALYLLLLALILAGGLAAIRARRGESRGIRPPALAAVYALLFLIAYVRSDFRVRHDEVQNFRYAMPLVPWLFLAVGAGVGALARHSALLGRVATGLAGLVILSFTAGTLAACDFGRARSTWDAPGTSDVVLARAMAMRYSRHVETLETVTRRLLATRPLERQHQILFVIGQNLKIFLDPGTTLKPQQQPRESYEPAIDLLHELVPQTFQPYFERPLPREKFYNPWTPEKREQFWKDYAAGSLTRPPRAKPAQAREEPSPGGSH